jgi:hypothetical protein
MTPFEYLGPYGRVAYGFTNAKAHYSLAQRGAWLTAWCMAGQTPRRDGRLKVKPLRALIGDLLDFLIEEGDLVRTDDPDVVEFARFEWANEPMDAKRRASKAYRDRQRGKPVDNLPSDDRHMTSDHASLLTLRREEITDDEEHGTSDSREVDPLDDFFRVTTRVPASADMRRWISDVSSAGPHPRDFGVVLADEFPKAHGDLKVAMKATHHRLMQMTERAAAAKRAEPKPVDPLQAEIREALRSTESYGATLPEPEATLEAIAAGKAAFAALRGQNGTSHGPTRVLPSSKNGSSVRPSGDARALTAGEGSDTESAAARDRLVP